MREFVGMRQGWPSGYRGLDEMPIETALGLQYLLLKVGLGPIRVVKEGGGDA